MTVNKKRTSPIFQLLLAIFLVGGICGCIAVMLQTQTTISLDFTELTEISFLQSLWRAGQFYVLCVLCASSLLGVVLIPILFFVRGYILCCTAGLMISSQIPNATLLSWIICGMPAVFQLPGLFILAKSCIYGSVFLISKALGSARPMIPMNHKLALLISVVSIMMTTFSNYYLIPLFIAKLQ